MRNQLLELISKTPKLIDSVKVLTSGDERNLRVEGWDESQHMFFFASMKEDIPEFVGDFGIPNIKLLEGLLNFPNYKADEATITTKKRVIDGQEVIDTIEFRNPKTKNVSAFRLRNSKLMKALTVKRPSWDITFTLDAGKLGEFEKLSSLYKVYGTDFGVHTRDGDLYVTFGSETSSTHHAEMVLQAEVEGEVRAGFAWSFPMFQALIASVGKTPTIQISKMGVMLVSVQTELGLYEYMLRAKKA